MIELERKGEIIIKIELTKIKDHLETTTIIGDKMKGSHQDRLEQCTMSISLIDRDKISEVDKEIEIFLVQM